MPKSLNVPKAVVKQNGPYTAQANRIIKTGGKDGDYDLTNFTAEIVNEIRYHDGNDITTYMEIDGRYDDKTRDGAPLPRIAIKATDFGGLNWIAEHWGARPVIFPMPNASADVRTAIQLRSNPKVRDIYTHTGWTMVNNVPTFLTATGGIHAGGLNPQITVELPNELQRYSLPAPAEDIQSIADSIQLTHLGPQSITWILLLATYRAAVGPADFAIHLAGRTGTFKSEISSLFQSHYGPKMDARHLPASWSATANALEALAYKAKNVLFTIDDFVPVGTAWQVRTLQAKADQIVRGQGNQAGRARMTDTIKMGTTFFPRGVILSTGEDIPEGHSVRGRMIIIELSPGDVEAAKLKAGQDKRQSYGRAIAQWVKWLASFDSETLHRDYAQQERDKYLGIGHSRTPSIIGELVATARLMAEWLEAIGAFQQSDRAELVRRATEAVIDAAKNQDAYLLDADPVTAFQEAIRVILTTGMGHVRTRNGGIPTNAERLGWTPQQTPGEMQTYKSNGPRLGWVDQEQNELYIDPANIQTIRRHAGGKLAITPQTLTKRLKEGGALTRTDPSRDRNTVRVTAEGHNHTVLSLALDQILQSE